MYKIYINKTLITLKDTLPQRPPKTGELIARYAGKVKHLHNFVDLAEKGGKYTRITLYHEDYEKLRKDFKGLFTIIEAGGGLVTNEFNEILFIFRRGHWDLPKGKLEKYETKKDAALREVEEEIGIPSDQISILGQLTDLYVFASNFMVYSFVGHMENAPKFIPQESEVASIVSFPINRLLTAEIIDTKDLQVRNIILKDVPYYKLNQHVLWGATAMITSEIVELINRAKESL